MATALQAGTAPGAQPDTIVLAAVRGATERALIEAWLGTREARLFVFDRPDAFAAPELARLVATLDDDATILAPVGVAWLPREEGGLRQAVLRDLFALDDPRSPSERRKRRRLAAGESERWRIVSAEPATLGELRARWLARTGGSGEPDFSAFVARQAELALARAEAAAQGARYKAPRIAPEDVMASPGFRQGLAALAARLGRPEAGLRDEVRGYLHELRTERSPFVLDLMMRFFRWAYSRAYPQVDVVPEQIAMLRDTLVRWPALVLPSHKANVDAPIVDTTLWEHGIAPPTLFAGINMAFWPMGPIMRKAGRIFLRRGIGSQPVYRFALRETIAYMVERRFDFEWFPEGTRSRTGKLLPPKLGLLTYVVDAYRQGRVEDVMLVPVALAYDQVYETIDFAREAQGLAKPPEGLRWMLEYMRELRRPYGKAYLRVAEPLSMREALGPPDVALDPKSPQALLAMQKLALAVCWRINQATPITGIALVSFALLGTGGRAVPRKRLERYAALAVAHAQARGQPLADSALIDRPGRLDAALDALCTTRVITRHEAGGTTLYGIAGEQHIAAAFYRNAMLHFVLERAIGEMATMLAAAIPPGEREDAFFAQAVRLREALKFEFFFRERPAFETALAAEMHLVSPPWRLQLYEAASPEAAFRAIFGGIGTAHSVLRAFVEAYWVVAELLAEAPADVPAEREAIAAAALGRGRRYLLERRVANPESVSRPLYLSALDWAANRKLIDPGPDLAERRRGYAERLEGALGLLAQIEAITRETMQD